MDTITAGCHEKLLREFKRIPPEYLPMLLQMVNAFRESITLKTADESFREGWEESMSGETFPVSKLWDGIDAE